LSRVKAHARSKLILVLLITAAMGGFSAFRKLKKKPKYEASVMFRLIEEKVEGGTEAPAPKAELRYYIFDAVLTRSNALQIMEQNKILALQRKLDLTWAMTEFLDRVSVDVFHNQFLLEDAMEEPRSARVLVTYIGDTPEESIKVVRDIAHLVIKEENEFRQLSAKTKSQILETTVLSIKKQISEKTNEKNRAQYTLALPSSTPQQQSSAKVRVQQLQELLNSLNWRLQTEIERKNHIDLQDNIETKKLGLRLEIVDWGRQPPPLIKSAVSATINGTIVFIFAFPIIGLVVGAYYQKITSRENIQALGIVALGHLRPYPGWDKFSLEQRLKEKQRG
jgi:hypothetical protein